MPHYDRSAPKTFASESADHVSGGDQELVDAAAALRETEIEAAGEQAVGAASGTGERATSVADDFDAMSIDELRLLAAELNVPNRELLVQRAEFIAALRRPR